MAEAAVRELCGQALSSIEDESSVLLGLSLCKIAAAQKRHSITAIVLKLAQDLETRLVQQKQQE